MRFVYVACAALCLIALSAPPALAQAQEPKGGVLLGVNAAYLTVPKDTGSTHSIGAGFVGGLFVLAPITKTINFQPEIEFSQRHSTITINGTDIDKKIDYISVPLMVRMALFKGLYVVEGAGLHFPVSAKSQRAGQAERDFKDTARTPDVSIVIGVGKRVSKHAILEGRWDSGLRQVETPVAAGEVVTRNRAITGLLVFPF